MAQFIVLPKRDIYLVSVGSDIRVGLDRQHARRIVAGLTGSRWVNTDRIRVTLISGTEADVTSEFRPEA
jgi:hypothetical protein